MTKQMLGSYDEVVHKGDCEVAFLQSLSCLYLNKIGQYMSIRTY